MRIVPVVLALTLATSAAAEEEPGGMRDGFGLIEQGTRQLLRGLMAELEPGLRDLQDRIGDLSAYHPPEIQPNGDILIRRKEPLEVTPETPDTPDGEIEL